MILQRPIQLFKYIKQSVLQEFANFENIFKVETNEYKMSASRMNYFVILDVQVFLQTSAGTRSHALRGNAYGTLCVPCTRSLDIQHRGRRASSMRSHAERGNEFGACLQKT